MKNQPNHSLKVQRNAAPFGHKLPSRLNVLTLFVGVLATMLRAGGIDPTFSDANWTTMGNSIAGADGAVRAVAVDDSANLYLGGSFKMAGNMAANSIAKWDGTNWSALGSGIQGEVHALFVSGDVLYAGGIFTNAGGVPANNIAKWDGVKWSALGSGIGGYVNISSGVYALSMSGSDLYAGGFFPTAGGHPVANIAKWNGSSWSALGSGVGGPPPFSVSSGVYALATSGSNLYAAGEFTTAGGTAATKIARWDGTNWFALDSGIEGAIYALAVAGSDLYVGGDFTTAGGNPAASIAKWDGTQWTALGAGHIGMVSALASSGGVLYAARKAGWDGTPTQIAKWDGSSWSALTGELNQYVTALALMGNNLYAAGEFTVAGNSAASHIAEWTGTNWSALGSGNALNGTVQALALLNGEVYAGGNFTVVGGSSNNYIARWTGSSWTAVGSGINGPIPGEPVWYPLGVYALAVSGSNLYAGGRFDTVGAIAARGIARWNGISWSALGAGISEAVYAMTASGNDLYVGGSFGTAGDVTANGIAKWDGTNWSALGSGMASSAPRGGISVRALAKLGNDLYAGGDFTTAGGNPAYYIARWDGTNWSAVGSSIPNYVSALAVSGGNLYAGGGFNYVLKWDGSTWMELFPGFNQFGTVSELAVSRDDVYAGGYFTTAGGSPAFHLAKWNGSSWSALGSGMDGGVGALLISGNDLYAGGAFRMAGGKISRCVARAYLQTLPTLSVLRSGPDVVVSWPSANTADFILEQVGQLSDSSWTTNSTTITDNGVSKSVTVPAANGLQFFRLRRP